MRLTFCECKWFEDEEGTGADLSKTKFSAAKCKLSTAPLALQQHGLWQVPASRAALWWREQLTHCSQQKLLHLSSRFFGARCGMTQKLGLNLTSASHHNYSNGSTSSLLLATAAVWSTGCLCHCGVIIGALAKPLSLSVAVGSLLKRAVFISFMFFFMTMDRARVIAGTFEAIKRWLGDLGSLFLFHHLCYRSRLCECVCRRVLLSCVSSVSLTCLSFGDKMQVPIIINNAS